MNSGWIGIIEHDWGIKKAHQLIPGGLKVDLHQLESELAEVVRIELTTGDLPSAGFQDQCNRPLCHTS